MKPTHLMKAFRDFARTGRVSREALADFMREGLVAVDEYGSPTLTSHGVVGHSRPFSQFTLHNLDRGVWP